MVLCATDCHRLGHNLHLNWGRQTICIIFRARLSSRRRRLTRRRRRRLGIIHLPVTGRRRGAGEQEDCRQVGVSNGESFSTQHSRPKQLNPFLQPLPGAAAGKSFLVLLIRPSSSPSSVFLSGGPSANNNKVSGSENYFLCHC